MPGQVQVAESAPQVIVCSVIDALLTNDCIRAARAHIERSDEATLARQAALSAIPAPTGAEAARGARVAEFFREIGLAHVKIDEVGNVRAWYGQQQTGGGDGGDGVAGACVVLSAHLDTVFVPGLGVSVARR